MVECSRAWYGDGLVWQGVVASNKGIVGPCFLKRRLSEAASSPAKV